MSKKSLISARKEGLKMMKKRLTPEQILEDIVLAGIDAGFKNVKYAYEINNDVKTGMFASAIELGEADTCDAIDTFFVNGQPYNTATRKNLKDVAGSKTKNNQMVYANMARAMFEISKALNFTKTKFIVSLGCSIATYRDQEAKEQYRQDFLKNKTIKVKSHWTNPETALIEYKEIELEILDVLPAPEGVSGVYNVPDLKPTKPYALIDLGGYNSQITEFQAKPNFETAICGCNGFDVLVETLVDKCANANLCDNTALIENCINEMDEYKENKNEEMQKIIQTIEKYIREDYVENVIKASILKANMKLGIYTPVFLGGTAKILKLYLTEAFPDALYPDDMIYASAIGMYVRTKKHVRNNKNRYMIEGEQKYGKNI